jgi:hypothetical protein
MRFVSRISAVLAILMLAEPVRAADPRTCALTPDVVATADLLLVDPRNERRFWRDRFSADAAYLLIRYGELPEPAARALVDRLAARPKPPQRIEELRLAMLPPAERKPAYLAARTTPVPGPGNLSVLRAFILDGEADWLFADVARAVAAGAPPQPVMALQVALARALADLDRDASAAVAAKAEAHGLWTLARDLAAMRGDMEAWLATVRRSPQPPADTRALASLFAPVWRGSLMPGITRPARDTLPADLAAAVDLLDANRPAGAEGFDMVLDLLGVAPAASILATAVNQTGEVRLVKEVVAPLLKGIRDRQIDPATDGDAIRALILAGTIHVLGPERARTLLASFPGPGDSWPAANALVTLERSLTRRTLAAYVRGEAPAPGRPPLLSADFDWSGWMNAASAIRRREPAPDSYRIVEAEVLFAAGRHAEALGVLRALGPTDEVRQQAYTMLVTLDQRCGGALWPQAPVFEPLYRFPPRRP